jgi:hypothetical protein
VVALDKILRHQHVPRQRGTQLFQNSAILDGQAFSRHREERSDEAIQLLYLRRWIASLRSQ